MKKNCVVVPVDFSNNTESSVRQALELAAGEEKIHLVHVLFALDAVSPGVVFGGVTDESRMNHINEKFAELKLRLDAPKIESEIRVGNPGLEIADYAAEIGADLIVIPSHGYHGVKRLVLGSVAERVIRHASCDVLVLRRSDAE
ncbi:MAG TPA: universal stress protein [Planctomycetaceae bacterium]|nr:universal stress protein [Planctomycetaceae bacterium]